MHTIAAIATPNSAGSVAVIRISGEDAFEIAERVFVPVNSKERPVNQMAGYTASYGKITDGDLELDDGVLLVFRAPKSYTGENVAEITCHGGVFVARRVLSACINAGASLAEAGEFTKRAVLNGKMSLTQAESVVDVINSVSEQYLICSNAQKSGSLHRKINEISERILAVSAHIAAWLDYQEEGLDDFEADSHIGELSDCRLQLSMLLKSYEVAATLREGIVTAIVGKPNAGKSTLMNLLTGRERSIVTDIPGTTRDVIEETVKLPGNDGVILRLCDCAGIRDTDDVVERIGIEYMYRQIEEASLILAVFDNSRPLEQDDFALLERIKGRNAVCIVNKIDLPDSSLDLAVLSGHFKNVVRISAKNADSLEGLSAVIGEIFDTASLDLSAGFIANERQRFCVTEAERTLNEAVSGLESGEVSLDVTGFLLENTLESLYRLSGKSAGEQIIDEVFRSFCVGK
ncbi:MAG: tRNA uridine-5-carboxymethylaminomethyl(34) synthesis GTPase MnmE [Oscillospiraceae bacterium]|nr:tRNA uridine-5-carboxymethylaminomethyl(34) synthesis GTPase MnmE [Oscillospiraceae bacterium]